MSHHFLKISYLLILVTLPIAIAGLSIAPWLPTRKKDLKRANKLANLKKDEVFYELGCGDARVSSYVALKNPQSKVIAFELALPLYFVAKVRSLLFPRKNLKIKLGNIFKKDLSRANVIYVFAMKESLNNKLKKKFLKELKKGTKIISYAFSMNDWEKGKMKIDKPSEKDPGMYVYEI